MAEQKKPYDKREYDQQYVKDHYKRISLNLKLEFYDRVQDAAEQAGVGVSEYIRDAITRQLNS